MNIPNFIRSLREGDVSGAYKIILEDNCFPAICGRICSSPCEIACILKKEKAPIGIRALERYVADFGKIRNTKAEPKGKRIAIVGGGPTGLIAAADLAKHDYQVTVFESLNKPGGVLRYGVPEFRIPKRILDSEINYIQSLGVKIETNFFIGQTATIPELMEQGFAAVLIATGSAAPKFMEIKGNNLGGVYYGEEFLMRANLMKTNIFSQHIPTFALGENVAVIGSGNTALDCARVAARLGRHVSLIFRGTEDDMRVRNTERRYAQEEGIHFEPLTKPLEILSDDNQHVNGLKCARLDFTEQDKDGQWKIEVVPESEFILKVDTVIIAIGHQPNSFVAQTTPNLKVDSNGTIKVDQKDMTSVAGVFAAGNVVSNSRPVIEALEAGRYAAQNIHQYLTS